MTPRTDVGCQVKPIRWELERVISNFNDDVSQFPNLMTQFSLTTWMLKSTSWGSTKPSPFSSQASNFPANDISCGRVQLLSDKKFCLVTIWTHHDCQVMNEYWTDWLPAIAPRTLAPLPAGWTMGKNEGLLLDLNFKLEVDRNVSQKIPRSRFSDDLMEIASGRDS